MKKIIKTVFVLGLAITSIACKKDADEVEKPLYQPTDYQVSADGKTLIRWQKSDISDLDMQGDVNLRKITVLKESIFSHWGQLKEVKLPDNLEVIEERAFENSGVTSIEIPKKVTRIESITFRGAQKLRSLKLNEGLRFIGSAAFYDCLALDNVQLPSTLVIISSGAFVRTSLYEITIPKSVTKIGQGAFFGCKSLTAITFEGQEPPVLEDKIFEETSLSHIYVPANSVDVYKALPALQKYVSIIKAKP